MITQYSDKVNPYFTDGNSTPCLVISNAESGRKKKPAPEKLMTCFDLQKPFVVYDGTQSVDDFCDIIVSGGDGTISDAVNMCKNVYHNIYYLPSGTVNDFGKIANRSEYPVLGKVGDKSFCYVFATGTFTSIGYTAKRKTKRKIGKIAYYFEALKSFRVQNVQANIRTEKEKFTGVYTLIMILRSPRCFGFEFNKMYDPDKKELYLLLVESPKNKFSLFWKFFRCFFVGFKRRYAKNNIIFTPIEYADVDIKGNPSFCLDGDEYDYSSPLSVNAYRFDGNIRTKRFRRP